MKRACLLTAVAVFCLAQAARDDYRAAYNAWRHTDPDLERDASAGGAQVAQRADRMAAEAAKFGAARKAFLEATIQDQSRQVSWLENAPAGLEPAATNTKPDSQFIAAETARVIRTSETFAADPDKGIQQLRQALLRERIALDGLSQAVMARLKSADAADLATTAVGQSRTKALDQARAMLDGLKDAAAQTGKETEAWSEYYRKLGEGAPGEAAPVTPAPPTTLANAAPAPPAITPVPLARYIGAWTWPQSNGLYHGAQPEFIDVMVHEENGHITGTAFGRFKLPPGSAGDPVLRFDFSGDLQPTRTQVLNLLTSDSARSRTRAPRRCPTRSTRTCTPRRCC